MSDKHFAGAVWWALIDFGDGEGEQKKYVILLNDCAQGETAFAALATSRGRRFQDQPTSECLCPKYPAYRIDSGKVSCFIVDTWVQFNKGRSVTRAILDQRTKDGKAGFILALDEHWVHAILNCAIASDDVPGSLTKAMKLAKKARSERAKLAKKSGATTPVQVTPKVDADILSVKARYEERCMDCRSNFAMLLEVSEEEVGHFLSGAKDTPLNFTTSAADAFAVLDDVKCAACAENH